MSPSRKVLVVEDEPLVADFISRGMQDNGYLVDIASDGEWALSRIRTDGYDLIILDLRLPGRGGLEICRELREKHCSIPILMLTALDG